MLITRRTWLRGTSAVLALPPFASLRPRAVAASSAAAAQPKRLVCIGNLLGFHPPAFWPQAGTNPQSAVVDTVETFTFGRSSKPLEAVRDKLTLIAGLDHGVRGGHFAVHAFLSGVKRSETSSQPNRNISLDQFAAEHIGGATRFPSLAVGDSTGLHGGCQMSWTRSGTRVPPIEGVSAVYRALFETTHPDAAHAAAARLSQERSILDAVQTDAQQFRKRLDQHDRQKFDEFLSSVRDVEQRIQLRRQWLTIAKPEAPFPRPTNTNFVDDLPLLYDMLALALQTDSTRVATLEIGGAFQPPRLGIQGDYHALSHHGMREDHIEALITLDTYQIEQFARFIATLATRTDPEGEPLLNSTTVLFGSGMGDANTHTNRNLPLVVAGGGFQKGQLLAFAPDHTQRPPLCNLFVSILQQLGVATDRFGTSTGTLRGLS